MVTLSRVNTRYKAEKLLMEGKVSNVVRTNNRFTFTVLPLSNKNKEHLVTCNSVKKDWTCDCKFWATRSSEDIKNEHSCSHIQACRLWLAFQDRRLDEEKGIIINSEEGVDWKE